MKIVLAYKRTGETYRGILSVARFDAVEPVGRHLPFEDIKFEDMIVKLHKELVANPDCMNVEFQRGELPNLPPFVLSTGDIELIRTDPVRAIKAMSPPPVRVKVGDALGKTKHAEPQTAIRAGHDTLADAFGDTIYCRMRGSAGECPCCGRWGYTAFDENKNGYLHCDACDSHVIGKAHTQTGETGYNDGGGWWTVDIRVLLQETTSERFYLPRAWNKTGPWISRADLQAKYESYLKEKERCLETQADTR